MPEIVAAPVCDTGDAAGVVVVPVEVEPVVVVGVEVEPVVVVPVEVGPVVVGLVVVPPGFGRAPARRVTRKFFFSVFGGRSRLRTSFASTVIEQIVPAETARRGVSLKLEAGEWLNENRSTCPTGHANR